ncbi:UDP-N-acetylmuramoyl-tripeptide--D-alanyl-D-alanine ligase [Pustulibacterium marinum]|uniref:UDP-N-acetylmuramoyl-tripeptide--D-alanyl-D-alanine ligase n=1 Tax=Pustulibacterium marinum TaxID=1224947 RepID=A0A1I7F4Q6_9FLAO|nr:UDP-N-acetylmuramoyl-tripeptide--D-alanyl-D-alanine ligase [Pustulibacterium marinum]SFU31075.1 UDP-N-acetylmuramoyl-tripeptide--D-alanyl-D-alanine ligase [Pustulibacterium marinum]
MNIEKLHQLFLESSGVTTDTRNIKNNNIFFALKGENFNGNTFTQEALNQGAKAVIIDEESYYLNEETTIVVEDVLKTLQKLANYHRNQCNATIISLTGSNGKTTTKELIFHALKENYNTIATQGNLNNHIGVPLSLLQIKEDTQFAIIEMGANHQKEIEFLCSIAEPDYGYITNFGKAHLEGFGGFEGVIKGKSELYTYLTSNNKTIFYNYDDKIQREKLSSYHKTFSFSLSNESEADIQIETSIENEFIQANFQDSKITSNLIGFYNSTNIAVAITIANYFNVPLDQIKQGIENYAPTNNRSQIIQQNSNKIILDAYNANPTSMQAALNNFDKTAGKEKYVIIGDMLELGNEASKEHQEIINITKGFHFNKTITLGKIFYNCDGQTEKFEDFEGLKKYISQLNIKNSIILIKGSRGMKMERLLEIL